MGLACGSGRSHRRRSGECHAIRSAATDLWCNQNCNHDPPFAQLPCVNAARLLEAPHHRRRHLQVLHQGGILGGYFANSAQYHKSPHTYGASNVAGIAGKTDHSHFSFVSFCPLAGTSPMPHWASSPMDRAVIHPSSS